MGRNRAYLIRLGDLLGSLGRCMGWPYGKRVFNGGYDLNQRRLSPKLMDIMNKINGYH